MSESEYDIEFENFKKVCEEVNPQIQNKLKAASALIKEAIALAEEHGIPFRPVERIMFCTPSYFPNSFKNKWSLIADNDDDDDNYDALYTLTGASGGQYSGWQSSQTC